MFHKLDWLFTVVLYACFGYIGLVLANAFYHFGLTLIGG